VNKINTKSEIIDKEEFSNELVNSDIAKNLNLNNLQSRNKDNSNQMDDRIHKINDKLNTIIKNSNVKTDETKHNTYLLIYNIGFRIFKFFY